MPLIAAVELRSYWGSSAAKRMTKRDGRHEAAAQRVGGLTKEEEAAAAEAQRRGGQREEAVARNRMQGDEGPERKCKATQDPVAPSAPKEDDGTAGAVLHTTTAALGDVLGVPVQKAVERAIKQRKEPKAGVADDDDAEADEVVLRVTLKVEIPRR